MTWRSRVVVGVGLAAVLAGLALAILEPAPLDPGDSRGLTVVAGLAMLVAIGYRVLRTRRWRATTDRAPDSSAVDGADRDRSIGAGPTGDGRGVEEWGDDRHAPPSAAAGAILERSPERTVSDRPLAGDTLARLTAEAAGVASEEGSVEAGLAVVRPTLREVTRDVLVSGGASEARANASLDGGEWTDDPVAASVLSGEVAPPPTSIRERLRAWLFPETVVRRRIARAVVATSATAEATLPTLPGQEVPRTRPVTPPRLEALEVGPEGSLRRGSAEGTATIRDGKRSVGSVRQQDDGDRRPRDGTAPNRSGAASSEPETGWEGS